MISTITGPAGVGKTALAVHLAHEAADRFPDGQFYVDLRGFDPAAPPTRPQDALRGFLEALGVPAAHAPEGLDAQAALYRSLSAGRRLLVLLDNARDAAQVRPLLPGTPGCLVLVTSRNRLGGLVSADGAHPVALGTLTPAEARSALALRIGAARVAAEPRATDEIVRLTARLPLALAVVAARAADRPTFPLATLAEQLRAAHGGLEAFRDADPAIDVRAVFSWSYDALGPSAARMFRLLSLHPGPEVTLHAGAALTGEPVSRARALLAELADARLVTERTPGRYACHDLLRAYATELVRATESEDERRASLRRMLDHLLHTAHTAALLFDPPTAVITPVPPAEPSTPPQPLADEATALAWLTGERAVLLGAFRQAVDLELDAHVWQFAWCLERFHERFGHWPEYLALQRAALEAARRLAAPVALAQAHLGLGRACMLLRRYTEAEEHLRASMGEFGRVVDDDGNGRAQCHLSLWTLMTRQERFREGLEELAPALGLYQASGRRRGEADVLVARAWGQACLGDGRGALPHAHRALALFQELEIPLAEGYTWDTLGHIHRQLGRHGRSVTCYRRALALFRAAGDLFNEACVLDRLGDAHHSAGSPMEALRAWESARDALHDFDPVWTVAVRQKIDLHHLRLPVPVTRQAHFVHCSPPTLPPPTNTRPRGASQVTMEELQHALWGEAPPGSPANAVYRHIGVLRRLLEPQLPVRAPGRWLLRDAGGYRLHATPETLDLLRFRELVRMARRSGTRGTEAAVPLLLEALNLRTGPVATGVPVEARSHPAFNALEREHLAVVKEAADVALASGQAGRLLAVLHRTATEHALDEPLQARLVRALAATGQRAAALDTWQLVRARLTAELGVEPGSELRAAQQEVLRVDARRKPSTPGRGARSAPVRLTVVPDTPAAATTRPAVPFVRPAQLPADLAAFAGRRSELAHVAELSGKDAPGTRIAVISGLGGIGKTTLAVRWAHRAAHRFPDGQLYTNLRGFAPGGIPADPAQVLRGFLEALGVPPQRVPAGADAQAGLYRSLLAGRRVLILLDNARDAEQVRPLLPASPGCLVVVTSRDRLLGLVTAEAARPLVLDRLPAAEARESLTRRLGADRVLADPAAVDEIVTRCAGLPLALAVVATRAAAHPHFALAAIADELRTTQGSLDAFTDADPAGDVRAVLSWSYRALSPDAARLLGLLSLHPGPDITLPGAAAVADDDPAAVRCLIAELTRAHLLTEHAPGRYACHDLLRTYAAECAKEHRSAGEREAAVRRLLDHYLHTAHAAGGVYSPFWRLDPLPAAAPGARPEFFADDARALRWYKAEAQVLSAVAERAVARGDHAHVWGLAWALERFMDRQGHWHDGAALQRLGLDAAVRDGHRPAQAHLHRGLARASARLERYDDARTHIRHSLDLFAELGDRLGLAHAHRSHGWLLDRLGDHDGALDAAGRALALYRALGDRAAETSALHALGWTHVGRGEHRRAAAYFEKALSGLAGLDGTRYAEAGAWDSLGVARHHLGEHRRAVAAYQCALGLYREVGDLFSEAGTLRHLGDTYLAIGDPGAARTVWERALRLLTGTDPTAAEEIRTRLLALGDEVPAPRIAVVSTSAEDLACAAGTGHE
ncbi:tetratricopeptide repeat protein [Streptomyces sp. NPDC001508]|uniref:tetratricopeptide repeat protein n=1 Tax=Streptomyces sp. NPDC001508 TaxID=3154656 RepID=UPI00333043FD